MFVLQFEVKALNFLFLLGFFLIFSLLVPLVVGFGGVGVAQSVWVGVEGGGYVLGWLDLGLAGLGMAQSG